MEFTFKIISEAPGQQSGVVDLDVEIMRPGGGRLVPPKVFTVQVRTDAGLDDIRRSVRRAMRVNITIAEMVGETFTLGSEE